jgi:hypothetical protein
MENQGEYRTRAASPEPPPEGQGDVVLGHVFDDLAARAQMGRQKYGTLLRINNGRDPLWDAYQEALDLVMYLRQAILERDHASGLTIRQERGAS